MAFFLVHFTTTEQVFYITVMVFFKSKSQIRAKQHLKRDNERRNFPVIVALVRLLLIFVFYLVCGPDLTG